MVQIGTAKLKGALRVRLFFCATLFAALVAFALSGCATTGPNQGDLNLISLDEEWRLGQQIEKELSRELTLADDRALNAYVSRMGQRIVAQTPMADRRWTFHVVADPEVNAFNTPGGHVYVNTGLITTVDNAAELAGVMAHEVAHGVARHGTERLSKAQGLSLGAGLLLGSDPGALERLAAQIVGSGALAKFSRDDEREADRLGVRYMHAASYNPEGMASMFEKLLSEHRRRPGGVAQFFSTHPLTEERIENVRGYARQLPERHGLITHDRELRGVQQRAARYR